MLHNVGEKTQYTKERFMLYFIAFYESDVVSLISGSITVAMLQAILRASSGIK